MTVKTKRYIELEDVLGLQLTCKGCGSVLDIPKTFDLSSRENTQKLDTCPVCLKPWVSLNGSTYHSIIAGFPAAVAKLRTVLEAGNLGFTLAVEISNDKPDSEKP
jgi:hypothetical protein